MPQVVDKKHNKHLHAMKLWPPVSLPTNTLKPFLDITIGMIIFFILAFVLDYFHDPNFSFPKRSLSGSLLILYMIITFYLRIKEAQHNARIYEMLWGCNMAMTLTGIGCILGRPLLVSTGIMIVGLDQLLWYIECIVYLLFGKFPFGVASYLVWPQTGFARKITTLHHLWFLPYGLYLLSPCEFVSFSYISALILNVYLVIAARILTPCNIWFPLSKEKDELLKAHSKNAIFDDSKRHYMDYTNINCAYEFWSDVPIRIFHIFNAKSPFLYIPYLSFCMNFLQLGPYFILRAFSKYYLEK